MTETVLYGYWRSSASYRVRIALGLAGIAYRSEPVDLLRAEQKTPEHLARNPQGLVPVLQLDGHLFTQSLAILEYIEETRPCGLLPRDPAGRQRVRAISQAIAMEIHPICNTGVVNHVLELTGGGDAERQAWMQHFIGRGLAAVERLLDAPETGAFCHGDTPGMADCCLIPQVYNATRWNADLTGCARIARIVAACEALPAFQAAEPERVRPA